MELSSHITILMNGITNFRWNLSRKYTMFRCRNKYLMYLLIAVMAFAPLEGVRAAFELSSAQNMKQPQSAAATSMSMHQQLVSTDCEQCMQKCKHCQNSGCGDQHQCQSGQCFSSSAGVLSGYDFEIQRTTQVVITQRPDRFIFSSPSLVFRPPRA